jgi:AraC-like DNA-binding protein
MKDKIYHLDLTLNGVPVPFIIRTMEEVAELQKGINDLPHRHNYYSVIWSFTATGRHIIDFREYPIFPQYIFFISPRQVHQVITDGNPSGMVILFTPEFLQQNSIREDFISGLRLFRDSDETPPMILNDAVENTLREFAQRMKAASDSQNEMKYETIGAYLKLFLIECNNQCTLHPDTNPQNLEVGRSLIPRFKELVEKHFREWHQVQDYARVLNISPNYLNEVIKLNIRTSAKDYILHRLILEAKRMVIFTQQSGKEFGLELGFEDPSHFSRFFKSHTRQSLVEFKETHIS